MADGSQLLMDENYMRESILKPQARVAAGYQPVMPTYQGLLKDREIDALIAYIVSLQSKPAR
jgi:cytochrome c oxidase subunit 2